MVGGQVTVELTRESPVRHRTDPGLAQSKVGLMLPGSYCTAAGRHLVEQLAVAVGLVGQFTGAGQQLTGLAVPVGDELGIDLVNHRSVQLGQQVDPVQAPPEVGSLALAGVHQ